jgi:hypothetical protein
MKAVMVKVYQKDDSDHMKAGVSFQEYISYDNIVMSEVQTLG